MPPLLDGSFIPVQAEHYTTLIILILFQEISGLFSGIALVVDPAGKLLQMPVSMLEGSPFGTTHSQNRGEIAVHKK